MDSRRLFGAACVDRSAFRLELTDVAGVEPLSHDLADSPGECRRLVSHANAGLSGREICVSKPCVGDERDPASDQTFSDCVRAGAGGRQAPGPLPDGIDRPSDRRFELFRTPRQEQRQHRIAEQSSLRNIGACDPEIRQGHLKSGTVPERDRHRFVLCEAVVCGHSGG